MRTARGSVFFYKERYWDESCFACYTHDKVLMERFQEFKTRKFYTNLNPQFARFQNLCIVVSHPHGQPKRITVGQKVFVDENHVPTFYYNADTCPGSSGAPVFGFLLDKTFRSRSVFLSPHSEYNSKLKMGQSTMVGWDFIDPINHIRQYFPTPFFFSVMKYPCILVLFRPLLIVNLLREDGMRLVLKETFFSRSFHLPVQILYWRIVRGFLSKSLSPAVPWRINSFHTITFFPFF